jgi:hypothetical protein
MKKRKAFDREGILTTDVEPVCSGLTKLEAFTKAAMQAMIKNSTIDTWDASNNTEGRVDDIARAAVGIARATLYELSKNPQP